MTLIQFADDDQEERITKLRQELEKDGETIIPIDGEELVTVAEILGHTDIRMTKRYSHAMHERKRQALEKLAATSNLRQMQNGRDVTPAASA